MVFVHTILKSNRYQYYRTHGVAFHWGIGTALSTSIMGVAFAFIVVEWCTQSHLCTENYQDAMQGLRRTRRFKKYTAWFRGIPNQIIIFAKRWWSKLRERPGAATRRSLVWTWQTRGEEEMLPIIEGAVPHDGQDKPTISHLELVAEDASASLLPRKPPPYFQGRRKS